MATKFAHKNMNIEGLAFLVDPGNARNILADDLTPNGVDGTNINGPGLIKGQWKFDAIDDYLDFGKPTSLEFDPQDAFTIEGWVWQSSNLTGQHRPICFKGANVVSENVGYDILLRDTGEIEFNFIDNSNLSWYVPSVSGVVPFDQWVHYAFTKPTGLTLSSAKLYVNGVTVSIGSTSDGGVSNTITYHATSKLTLGASHAGTTAYYEGYIALHSASLGEKTEAKILDNYAIQKKRFLGRNSGLPVTNPDFLPFSECWLDMHSDYLTVDGSDFVTAYTNRGTADPTLNQNTVAMRGTFQNDKEVYFSATNGIDINVFDNEWDGDTTFSFMMIAKFDSVTAASTRYMYSYRYSATGSEYHRTYIGTDGEIVILARRYSGTYVNYTGVYVTTDWMNICISQNGSGNTHLPSDRTRLWVNGQVVYDDSSKNVYGFSSNTYNSWCWGNYDRLAGVNGLQAAVGQILMTGGNHEFSDEEIVGLYNNWKDEYS